MLKHILLASAVLISTPALAQNKPGDPQSPPPSTDTMPAPTTTAPQTAPVNPAPPTTTAPTAPTTAVPAAPAPAAPAAADAAPVPADPAAPAASAQAAAPAPADPAVAAASPAPAPGGVADVVNAEFGTYDKNANGTLSRAEFGTWMFALKQKADPASKDDAANKAWTAQAFAQADTDKSKSISKDELTNFLSKGQKAS